MAFQIMASSNQLTSSELPWLEEWVEKAPPSAIFPRQVHLVKAAKSGKGFLIECDVFIAFAFKKDSRAMFIDQYLYRFSLEAEAPSLLILPCKENPKQWQIGIDDDLAVKHKTLNDWTTEIVPVTVESPTTGKRVTKAYTHPPDSPCHLTRDEPESEAPTKRPRKSAKNTPKTDGTAE